MMISDEGCLTGVQSRIVALTVPLAKDAESRQSGKIDWSFSYFSDFKARRVMAGKR